MDVLIVAIVFAAAGAVLGVAVRRWWLLLLLLAYFTAWYVEGAITGGLRDYDTTVLGQIIIGLTLMLIPAEIGAALGVSLGRREWPPRRGLWPLRRRTSA